MCIYPDTTRSRTLYSPILLKFVTIQIQHALYYLVCIVQIQLALEVKSIQISDIFLLDLKFGDGDGPNLCRVKK